MADTTTITITLTTLENGRVQASYKFDPPMDLRTMSEAIKGTKKAKKICQPAELCAVAAMATIDEWKKTNDPPE